MKIDRQVNEGKFGAEGTMIEPAAIIITWSELTLDEYKETSLKLSKTFGINPPESILRKHKKVVILDDNHGIHDGRKATVDGRQDDLS